MEPPVGLARAVQHTRELERVLRLPRRTWTNSQAEDFALRLSAVLKKPAGTMGLRPIQAIALYEATTYGGLFGPIGVGEGKTLISLLVPFVTRARRPLLLTKANLIEKTRKEARELAYHWPIPNFIRIESYDKLGRANHADLLEHYQPDEIIADEAHKLRNERAAVTRRVSRYMQAHPSTVFVAISGTITRTSILDYAHLLKWCLKPGRFPLPDSWSELEDWAGALDDAPSGEAKTSPGALVYFCNEQDRKDPDLQNAVRKAYARRLTETPGVVSSGSEILGTSLTIEAIETDMSRDVDEAFHLLRTTWTTPDGWPVSDPMTLNRHARELALGFFYKWEPRPPEPWMLARRAWAHACREILSNNRRNLDSELQVINAVDQGHYPEAEPLLEAWRQIAPTFTPNTVPVWLDNAVIDLAARWAMTSPGIIWCEHVAFAERLASQTNLAYYGEKGLDRNGRPIESHPRSESLIASVASNAEGRNLQAFSRNLVVSPPANGQRWEQLLGRTHRTGQKADEVVCHVVVTALEHVTAFDQAKRQAAYIRDIQQKPQRLCYADIVYPDLDAITGRSGPRWRK